MVPADPSSLPGVCTPPMAASPNRVACCVDVGDAMRAAGSGAGGAGAGAAAAAAAARARAVLPRLLLRVVHNTHTHADTRRSCEGTWLKYTWAHSTQHTAHSTQHTAHSTQHTAHSTPHTLQGAPLGRSLRSRITHAPRVVVGLVLTRKALAVLAAGDAGLEALAVLLLAPGLLAVAPLGVPRMHLGTDGGNESTARASSHTTHHMQQGPRTPALPDWIFGLNALGLRSRVCVMAASRMVSWSWVLLHPQQWHSFEQTSPAAKHSQYLRSRVDVPPHAYSVSDRPPTATAATQPSTTPAPPTHSFRHLDFLQLHGVRRFGGAAPGVAFTLPPRTAGGARTEAASAGGCGVAYAAGASCSAAPSAEAIGGADRWVLGSGGGVTTPGAVGWGGVYAALVVRCPTRWIPPPRLRLRAMLCCLRACCPGLVYKPPLLRAHDMTHIVRHVHGATCDGAATTIGGEAGGERTAA